VLETKHKRFVLVILFPPPLPCPFLLRASTLVLYLTGPPLCAGRPPSAAGSATRSFCLLSAVFR